MRLSAPGSLQLFASACGGVVVGLLGIMWLDRPVPARLATTAAAISPAAGNTRRLFANDAGMMVKFVRPDRTAEFESTVGRLRAALATSDRADRRQQAASWKVFRASESATNGDAVYVFVMDPAIKGADYAVSTILAEAFPDEAELLYREYVDANGPEQNVVDMKLIAAFGSGR